jgi:hypothetical protein
MAVFDRRKEMWLTLEREAVDAFKEFMRTEEGEKAFPKGLDLIRHIERQGAIVRDQETQIKKY